MLFHPWRTLRYLPHIRVLWVLLPGDQLAKTNGVDLIWMDSRLLQVERRCALTHELIHIEAGHNRVQDAKTEAWVADETARRLITIHELAKQMAWACSFDELADELWVTGQVLADRVSRLTPGEWAIVEAQSC